MTIICNSVELKGTTQEQFKAAFEKFINSTVVRWHTTVHVYIYMFADEDSFCLLLKG